MATHLIDVPSPQAKKMFEGRIVLTGARHDNSYAIGQIPSHPNQSLTLNSKRGQRAIRRFKTCVSDERFDVNRWK